MTAIVDIIGREILDSRGNPTVEVDVVLEDGSMGRAAAFRSTSSGRPAACPRASGFRTRVSRPIAAAAKGQSLPAATRIIYELGYVSH